MAEVKIFLLCDYNVLGVEHPFIKIKYLPYRPLRETMFDPKSIIKNNDGSIYRIVHCVRRCSTQTLVCAIHITTFFFPDNWDFRMLYNEARIKTIPNIVTMEDPAGKS